MWQADSHTVFIRKVQVGMVRKKRVQKKSIFKLWMLVAFAVFLFLLLFRREVMTVLAYRFTDKELDGAFYQARSIVRFNIWRGFFFTFLFWLFIASLQSLLPVSGIREVYRTMRLVVAHAFKKRNYARIVGGKFVSPPEKFQRLKIDYRSEVRGYSEAFEENPFQYGGIRGLIILDSDSAAVLERGVVAPNIFNTMRGIIGRFLLRPEPEPLRICGPGLVFVRRIERVHSFVDLRKQIRSENGVVAFTGDGMEISTFVFSVFSIGRNPKPLQLAFNGGHSEEQFQTVELKKEENGSVRVEKFVDDLAPDDRWEAYRFARAAVRMGQVELYSALPDPGIRPAFDERRVFGAVYARARNGDSEPMNWDKLPLIFTKDAFKEMAAQFNFDELSNPDGGSRLQEFKNRVNTAVRNQSVLTYRIVLHKSGQPLEANHTYPAEDLLVSPVRAFTTPKVLRERGIMNIYSAFTTVTPCLTAIYEQRLDNWQARLERETNLVTARRELEVRNIYSRARMQAQQELSTALNDILKDRQYSEEAMALLVFQALEEYAHNPQTRQRLPNEIITLLRNVHDRILPSDARGFPFLRD